MPWIDNAGALLSAWYSGAKGGEAMAAILFGEVNPSGRLPVTFPTSIEQYPRLALPGWGLPPRTRFDVDYEEGAEVGYRRFAARGMKPRFAFGFGLSYTSFAYANLEVSSGETVSVRFDVTNTGARAGKDAPQVYLTSANGRRLRRLIGFAKIALEPGETRSVSLTADARLLADFDAGARHWRIGAGEYEVAVGASAEDLVLSGRAKIDGRTLPP